MKTKLLSLLFIAPFSLIAATTYLGVETDTNGVVKYPTNFVWSGGGGGVPLNGTNTWTGTNTFTAPTTFSNAVMVTGMFTNLSKIWAISVLKSGGSMYLGGESTSTGPQYLFEEAKDNVFIYASNAGGDIGITIDGPNYQFRPLTDIKIELGSSTFRWRTLYCTNIVQTGAGGATLAGTLTSTNGVINLGTGWTGTTNATAPVNAVTPAAWVNYTNSTGGVFKLPLYQ